MDNRNGLLKVQIRANHKNGKRLTSNRALWFAVYRENVGSKLKGLYCFYFGVKSCMFWSGIRKQGSRHLGESRILPFVNPCIASKINFKT